MERIESVANAKVKLAASLKQRKYRVREGVFLAEGIRLLEVLAASEITVRFCIFSEDLRGKPRAEALLEKLQTKQIPCYETSKMIYEKASATEHSQGILAVVEQRNNSLEDLEHKKDALYVILDGLQDPGNLGTILRTAVAVGADGVILTRDSADYLNPKAIRSSMGAVFQIKIATDCAPEDVIAFCRARGALLYGAALDRTAQSAFSGDYRNACAIAFGNEGAGLSERILAEAKKIYLPMKGEVESLNVAAASAVILYEVYRQRL